MAEIEKRSKRRTRRDDDENVQHLCGGLPF